MGRGKILNDIKLEVLLSDVAAKEIWNRSDFTQVYCLVFHVLVFYFNI